MRSTASIVKQGGGLYTIGRAAMMRGFEFFVRALEHLGCEPVVRGHRGMALCPAHQDRMPSLSIACGGRGRVLVHCFAGCDVQSVLASMGADWSMLFESDEPWPGRESVHDEPGPLRYRADFLPLDILEQELERMRGPARPRPVSRLQAPGVHSPRIR